MVWEIHLVLSQMHYMEPLWLNMQLKSFELKVIIFIKKSNIHWNFCFICVSRRNEIVPVHPAITF